jgi:hypothetical protein
MYVFVAYIYMEKIILKNMIYLLFEMKISFDILSYRIFEFCLVSNYIF